MSQSAVWVSDSDSAAKEFAVVFCSTKLVALTCGRDIGIFSENYRDFPVTLQGPFRADGRSIAMLTAVTASDDRLMHFYERRLSPALKMPGFFPAKPGCFLDKSDMASAHVLSGDGDIR